MTQIIKIKCNGPTPHLNEVDLDKLPPPETVVKSSQSVHLPPQLPERLVQKCQFCAEGRVIITREMIQTHLPK
jgi:hypothetical protein